MNYRVADMLKMLTVGRTTLWRMVKAGQFPEPNRENSRKIFWTEEQLKQWAASLK
ncbi:AlpA family phage regulatory protein [Shewanella submarina]|uniref:Helix-turn-helix transcriptional regulator n=1 Tax=Shewanella submarina TaxID=2016376 RepID=A0ABV7GL11_9GAMM|nr:AlpA family phage regulatory protein [Shewanella submarina]MCL1039624.1 AlpA family phage regulatory protein [Shewanella submarina]